MWGKEWEPAADGSHAAAGSPIFPQSSVVPLILMTVGFCCGS